MLKPKWTYIETNAKTFVLVRTLDIENAMDALCAALPDEELVFHDKDDEYEGEGYSCIRDIDDDTPEHYDIAYLAQRVADGSEYVRIIDCNGYDIHEEYLESQNIENDDEDGAYMSKTDKIKTSLVGSARALAGAGTQGIKLAGAHKMNNAAFEQIKPMLSKYGLDVENPAIKAAIMGVLPVFLHPLASMLEEQVPYARYVQQALELSFAETVRDNSVELLGFATNLFGAMYQAGAGQTIAQVKKAINYNKYNKVRLKEIAKERGIEVKSRDAKDDIVLALQEADAEEEIMITRMRFEQ